MSDFKKYKGFTLIEILVAISIAGVVGLGLVSLQYILSQNQIAISGSYKIVDSVNLAASTIAREIRGARESENGAYMLAYAGDYEIVFYSDIDFDGRIEWVRYFLDNTNIIKETIKPTGYPAVYDTDNKKETLIISDIKNDSSPIFYYYNENWPTDTQGNPLPSDQRLAKTKTIKILLKVGKDQDAKKIFTIETSAQIRNSKENL